MLMMTDGQIDKQFVRVSNNMSFFRKCIKSCSYGGGFFVYIASFAAPRYLTAIRWSAHLFTGELLPCDRHN